MNADDAHSFYKLKGGDMVEFSRRQIGLSVGLIAAGGLLVGVGPTEAARQVISFTAAKEAFSKLLIEMIANSEKDFGVIYTADQRTDIENRTWDGVQRILSAHYVAEETPPEFRKPKHTGLKPTRMQTASPR